MTLQELSKILKYSCICLVAEKPIFLDGDVTHPKIDTETNLGSIADFARIYPNYIVKRMQLIPDNICYIQIEVEKGE